MQLTVLGHWGAYPEAGEATSGYLLEHRGRRILLDCGSGVLSVLQNELALHELDAVFISHQHYDHIADLGCLQYACLIDTDLGKRTEPLPIYVAEPSEGAGTPACRTMKGSVILPVGAGDSLELYGLKFEFFRTFHEVYCLGCKITDGQAALVYTADTYYDESLIGFCEGANVLVAETSFYADFQNARNYGHMNSAEVGYLASQAKAETVVLTHLPHFGDRTELIKEVKRHYGGEVILAAKGLKLPL
ncbi:ribonuclease Z [Paenibacillus konkukensis]|uniref:Ribonuclease Z n=1 Tax=Paenibacillus konkukensis TaxID=2020716 RepID=A0ABY4RHJ3_9BACL|nr:MBL fold metallo-hydrolase [Paenibacillus konkukensis]UQZ81632.1 ribonuclease Z [Paenibacillus konkukensis]